MVFISYHLKGKKSSQVSEYRSSVPTFIFIRAFSGRVVVFDAVMLRCYGAIEGLGLHRPCLSKVGKEMELQRAL